MAPRRVDSRRVGEPPRHRAATAAHPQWPRGAGMAVNVCRVWLQIIAMVVCAAARVIVAGGLIVNGYEDCRNAS